MKKFTLYLFVLIAFISLNARVEAQSYDSLDINNVVAPFNADGYLFWNFVTSGFEVPKGSGKHTVFAGAPWIGGIDGAGLLHVAAQTYRQTGSDFFPGPYKDSASNNLGIYNLWNHIWKI